MVCDGGMRPRSMPLTRRSATGSFAGPAWASLAASSSTLRPRAARLTLDDRRQASQGASDGCQSAHKGDLPRLIGCTKGGLNSKLHGVCIGGSRPVIFVLTEGQMSDHKGVALIYPCCQTLRRSLLTKATTVMHSERLSTDAASRLAFHREPSASCPQHTARLCIGSAINSRIRSRS